ncbi:M13 family metallopeptidase [Oleiagrimonas sp. C23AA]|uniref:M13 family metallopeptidase n=1 Tax=Oleiagrimonas sp. C23AA TaxID=2719047 RepID=UPI00141FD82A|nr:M13 family metallopeptidase [Oleiagrimonas sp. C23AA]NII10074.1 M13 family metallopeptidase [Oleiagrimonas sp. C23AA]
MNKPFLKPLALAVGLALAATGCSQNDHSQDQAKPAKPAAASSAKQAAPASSGSVADANTPVFDISELDTQADPCNNFNAFVNEKWVKANPIPADQTSWGSFNELREKSLNDQHSLVEAAAKNAASAKPGSIEQKIGYLYNSAMNMDARNKAGFDPIKPDLASIDAIKSHKDLQPWLDKAFAKGDGRVFGFGSGADFKNAKMQIGYAEQSGLGLPTPAYYTDAKYKDVRDAYTAYMAKLFQLTGDKPDQAKKQADLAMKFETELAKHSVPRVELRDPKNQYHFVSLAEANKITPHFDWKQFFTSQGVTVDKGFSLSQPKFFKEFDHLVAKAPMDEWKAYLKAHTISGAANALSEPFVDASFDFYGKTLSGQPQNKPQWKRSLGAVNGAMGQALGQLYVAKYFPPEAKERADQLVHNVLAALKNRIQNLDWMSDTTKQKALEKWSKFLPKIGYPDHWRSWDGLKITQDDYYANLERAGKFNYDYDIAKIGKPTDRHEWGMTPQTVNAYYNPTDNTINFPAAILQPPFFYAHGDDAINYGGIGAVIGHESSHGFDDQGSQFDGNGNQENWWTKADRKQFDARTKKLVDQFDAYKPLKDHPDLHVNGKLTLGENIADLGGLNIAYDALQTALKNHPEEANKKIDGYTEDQRFFMNWARVWRGEIREKRQMVLLNADPHSPMKFRAIGAPSNMPAFAQAFQCKPGDKMVRPADKRVKIW